MSNVAQLFPDTPAKPADFDSFWAWCPRKTGKLAARRAWDKMIREYDPAEIIAGARHWNAEWRNRSRDELRFCPHPSTWLNAGRWMDYDPDEQPKAPQVAVRARSDVPTLTPEWQVVIDALLAARTAPAAYLSKLTLVGMGKDGEAVLRADSGFVRQQIEGSYLPQIERAWGRRVVVR